MAYTRKKHIPREAGIPLKFPLKCYQPADNDIPPYSPEILVGMDSGISNTAFSYIELIRDEITNAVIDFKYGGTYYFKFFLIKLISRYILQADIMTCSAIGMYPI